MRVESHDILVLGGGGAGLRTALAIAEAAPDLSIRLASKVYPMRSHTVAAEGGAAGVAREEDSLDLHFRDTVAGGDWLCDQHVVRYFVEHATAELARLERWGCPWTRQPDGAAAVRRFGGMSSPRTWFAADKTGFHILHTLFQTSLRFPQIQRADEFFCVELLVHDGRCQGALAIELRTGDLVALLARAVVLATGGAGRIYRQNTNGGIVTGDGIAMALRAGVALRDLEFVQYHPTALPGSGVLITEAARGEGGLLLNGEGRRYLQDYGLGPETPPGASRPKTMELGPRDKLSQAFWHEHRAGRTVSTEYGEAVLLDLRHLGRPYLDARLPLICGLARMHVGVDPALAPIPVRPAVHYSMGGVATDITGATTLPGLYAAGEVASVGLHGANRLGSNSLAELLVFGRAAGEAAATFAAHADPPQDGPLRELARHHGAGVEALRGRSGTERLVDVRQALGREMDEAFGIYRHGERMAQGLATLADLAERAEHLRLHDASRAFNTELTEALELRAGLEVALALAAAAVAREESRGAHQRLDDFGTRDDARFLKHSSVTLGPDGRLQLGWKPVVITDYPPAERRYGAAGGVVSP